MQKKLTLKCLFCNCNLEWDTEKEYLSGDMVKCQACGELNDYDALEEVKRKYMKQCAEDKMEEILKKNGFK